jgi:hypothetical protein
MSATRNETARWWLGAAAGAVVTVGVLTALSSWLPATPIVALGWLGFALPGPAVSTRWPAWRADAPVGLALLSAALIGLGLALGAFWFPEGPRGTAPVSLVLGTVLFLAASALSVVRAKRFSRREVDAEVERHRAEHAAPTTTTTGAAADDLT